MKVIIIGGMAAGPKTAARLRRLVPDAEITIVEQGEFISFGSCGMPFYLANLVPEFSSLYATSYGVARDIEFFRTRKDIRILAGTRATGIDRERKRVSIIHLESQIQSELEYDYLVLATGAVAITPPIKGLETPGVFTMHQPNDALRLQEYLRTKNAQHVTIIGAGVIGMEVADALAGRRIKVTVCEAQNQVLPKLLDPDIAQLVAAQMKQYKVDLQLKCRVKAINCGEDGSVNSITTNQGEIITDAVIVATGVRPRVDLAQVAGLELASNGAIKVDAHLRTSDPHIFAAGDCASQINKVSEQEVYIPLASTANKQGRVVADNIAGLDTEFSAVMGTTVLQAFDLNIGKTGLGEFEAVSLGNNVISGIVSGHDSPHYYPLHSSLTIKLIADRSTGRLLGAQVCGAGEAIKRVDVFSVAIKFGASLKDIANLDLGYAPPYSEAIDIAIHAANTLENKRCGLSRGISPLALDLLKNTQVPICFLDIREPDEVKAKPLSEKDVLLIPAGELRERYHEIPCDRPVVVVCGLGIRSYDAVCFLQSMGLEEAVYLEGGISIWL
ncbi:FAD-dependent pyridine nucleotide-disulphide oxidoreductase [Syntrophomonas zehnderi OL-4]|uniref:FAD-dependent pyridine nucleotide-disulphide oxidoreductase n=1 Tax=Syntrophomonas zehnderi OL-4 TaxID=690567 RepID=A0A0E4GB00_9FIRM|nr:FAD-dependent oxidoreductase [Syntrophomonas zehnderi]CFX70595.1 FAD-dependent pyridine nucleotide-disulphide oxidoreductase [Syntrophomonas zehnderi OL-4]